MNEDIVVVEGNEQYGVTADGRVWSRCKGPWRALALTLNTRGYPKVKLDGRTVNVHTLIAHCFHGPRPVGMTVNHIDGVKTNATASNLEYVTQAENNRHAWHAGLQRNGWEARRKKAAGRFGPGGSYTRAA